MLAVYTTLNITWLELELLSFSTEAKRYFDPIAATHGLSCTSASESEVLYEDARVFLSLSFDNGRSYELSVRCGPKASPIEPARLSEIMRLENSPEDVKIDGLISSTATALHTCLVRLSDLTMRYAPIAFNASDAWYERLAELRREESRKYAVRSDLISSRKEADAAWKQKDFAGVVAALAPVRFYLSTSERKRLDYATGKCTLSRVSET